MLDLCNRLFLYKWLHFGTSILKEHLQYLFYYFFVFNLYVI